MKISAGILLTLLRLGEGAIVAEDRKFRGRDSPSDETGCPGQEKSCRDGVSNGVDGYYAIHTVSPVDGTCQQLCVSRDELKQYLLPKENDWQQQPNGNTKYVCGACPIPSCPDPQEPCQYFNGVPAYQIYRVNPVDGTCTEMCAAANSLARQLHGKQFQCGTCPIPACDDQPEPCSSTNSQDNRNNYFSTVNQYRVYRIDEESGLCDEQCAAGNQLIMYQSQRGYVCGTCPEVQVPPALLEPPAQVVAAINQTESQPVERKHKVEPNETNPVKSARQARPKPPSCLNQAPCRKYAGGWNGYYIHKVDDDGNINNWHCTEICASGAYLTYMRHTYMYQCGNCPSAPSEGGQQDGAAGGQQVAHKQAEADEQLRANGLGATAVLPSETTAEVLASPQKQQDGAAGGQQGAHGQAAADEQLRGVLPSETTAKLVTLGK